MNYQRGWQTWLGAEAPRSPLTGAPATPLEMSIETWIVGGLVGGITGAIVDKNHRVLGAIGGSVLGAFIIGTISDKLIERHYTPKWRASQEE